MITIDKVSERAKKRVVEIFTDKGVSGHTLRVCASGLVGDEVTGGVGLSETIELRDALVIADKVAAALNGNERYYSELALRIFANSIADREIEIELNRQLGTKI